MSQVVDTKECMFFVGGNDNKSNSPTGQANAGGCTKAWWDAEVASTAAITAMGKLMGTDGEPVASVSTTVHDADGSNNVKIVDTVGGGFSNVEPGMILFHTTGEWMDGDGFYEVIEVDAVSGDYVVLDMTWNPSAHANDGDLVVVGGAWNSVDSFIDDYIAADDYSHEIWVNKDLAPSIEWDWSGWSGDVGTNAWLKITGFHRVPGDITDPNGAYFQTAKDMFDNGVHADRLVEVDLSGRGANSVISEASAVNIRMSGFNFCNGVASCEMFSAVSGSFINLDFVHNAFEVSALWNIKSGENVFFSDCFFEHSDVYVSGSYMFDTMSQNIEFINNYFKNMDCFGMINYSSVASLHGNIFQLRTGSHSDLRNHAGSQRCTSQDRSGTYEA